MKVTLDKMLSEIARLEDQLTIALAKYNVAENNNASKIQKQHLLNTAGILERRINDLKELVGKKQ